MNNNLIIPKFQYSIVPLIRM